ncbi:MAG: hypothetical protein LBS00_07550 [Synergistaceae bacterium]|nr:hypothetical protein [Synergistaceae bacterium]
MTHRKIFIISSISLTLVLSFFTLTEAALKNFENISLDVPDDWQVTEEKEDGAVMAASPGSAAVVAVMVSEDDAKGVDSKTYAEVIADAHKGTPPRETEGGRYAFTYRTPEGKLGRLCAWAENGTGLLWMAIGGHPELAGVLASVKIRGEHPGIEETVAMLAAGDFGHFSADVPTGWETEDDGAGGVTITSPGNAAILLVNVETMADGEDSEALADEMEKEMAAQGHTIGEREKRSEGYYKIPITNQAGVSGFVLSGVEDGVADTMLVIGEHRDLKKLLRSMKAGYGRGQLAKMFGEARQ